MDTFWLKRAPQKDLICCQNESDDVFHSDSGTEYQIQCQIYVNIFFNQMICQSLVRRIVSRYAMKSLLTWSGLTSSQSLPTLMAVRMLSPVTMTVLMSASWRLLMAGYVSSLTRFCITIRPRNSDFSSRSGLLQKFKI